MDQHLGTDLAYEDDGQGLAVLHRSLRKTIHFKVPRDRAFNNNSVLQIDSISNGHIPQSALAPTEFSPINIDPARYTTEPFLFKARGLSIKRKRNVAVNPELPTVESEAQCTPPPFLYFNPIFAGRGKVFYKPHGLSKRGNEMFMAMQRANGYYPEQMPFNSFNGQFVHGATIGREITVFTRFIRRIERWFTDFLYTQFIFQHEANLESHNMGVRQGSQQAIFDSLLNALERTQHLSRSNAYLTWLLLPCPDGSYGMQKRERIVQILARFCGEQQQVGGVPEAAPGGYPVGGGGGGRPVGGGGGGGGGPPGGGGGGPPGGGGGGGPPGGGVGGKEVPGDDNGNDPLNPPPLDPKPAGVHDNPADAPYAHGGSDYGDVSSASFYSVQSVQPKSEVSGGDVDNLDEKSDEFFSVNESNDSSLSEDEKKGDHLLSFSTLMTTQGLFGLSGMLDQIHNILDIGENEAEQILWGALSRYLSQYLEGPEAYFALNILQQFYDLRIVDGPRGITDKQIADWFKEHPLPIDGFPPSPSGESSMGVVNIKKPSDAALNEYGSEDTDEIYGEYLKRVRYEEDEADEREAKIGGLPLFFPKTPKHPVRPPVKPGRTDRQLIFPKPPKRRVSPQSEDDVKDDQVALYRYGEEYPEIKLPEADDREGALRFAQETAKRLMTVIPSMRQSMALSIAGGIGYYYMAPEHASSVAVASFNDLILPMMSGAGSLGGAAVGGFINGLITSLLPLIGVSGVVGGTIYGAHRLNRFVNAAGDEKIQDRPDAVFQYDEQYVDQYGGQYGGDQYSDQSEHLALDIPSVNSEERSFGNANDEFDGGSSEHGGIQIFRDRHYGVQQVSPVMFDDELSNLVEPILYSPAASPAAGPAADPAGDRRSRRVAGQSPEYDRMSIEAYRNAQGK